MYDQLQYSPHYQFTISNKISTQNNSAETPPTPSVLVTKSTSTLNNALSKVYQRPTTKRHAFNPIIHFTFNQLHFLFHYGHMGSSSRPDYPPLSNSASYPTESPSYHHPQKITTPSHPPPLPPPQPFHPSRSAFPSPLFFPSRILGSIQ